MGFVSVKGNKFELDGTIMKFAGLGIGSWLNIEHFMVGIPTNDKQIKEAFKEVFGLEKCNKFFDDFVKNFCTEDDFKFLKDTGINLVRVPFNYRIFIDDNNPHELKEEGFRYFDRLIEMCTKYKIYLLPDLHAVPGGQNPDWHSDNQTGIPQFWHFDLFQEQMVFLWKSIAERYVNEEYILGYDLLNEPFLMPAEDGKLQSFYEKVTETIRQVDNNHIIFLEGDFFAMDFSAIKELKDEQTAITFHFYPTVWEADLCDLNYPREKRRKVFEERFQKLLSSMNKFGRPLLCGEAGYGIEGDILEHVLAMVEDTLDLFNKYKVSWTLWCYKDAKFMGLVYPKENSLWLQFVNEIHKYWTHYREMDMGKNVIDDISKMFPGKASEELKYQMQFRQRAIFFKFQKEQILKPVLEKWGWEKIEKMTESFLMKNCNYYKDYQRLITKYLDI
jgi:aryl-phospho-beta-D-glucosidase BglC (GH1 family)